MALASTSVVCLSGTVSVQAQQIAPGVPEQVVITGRLEEDLPARLAQMGTRIDIVPGAEIKNGGYIDIAHALQTSVPGLYIAPKNGPFDYVDISLQGSRTQDVLWLVDGVRINNRLYGGTTPLDTIPASMVERIEVLEGAQALFYGTQGIAGAINVITKDFSDSPDGSLTAGFDTNNGRHLDGYFRDSIGANHFVVYGSSDKSDGYQPFRDQDYQPSQTDRRRAYDVLTIGGKYAYDFNDALRLSISEQHTDATLDFAKPTRSSALSDAGGAATALNERNEDILSTKLDYTPRSDLQFFVKGYYHWWYAHYTEFDNSLTNPGTLITIDNHDFWGFTDYGVNALAKFTPASGVDTFAGYDYQNYTGRDVVLVITQKTEHVHALFGEIATNKDLFSNVQFAAGLRLNMPSVGPSATVWNVSGRWDVTPDLFVKGTVGTAFRLPTAEELFADDPLDERGNPALKPETSTNVNLSIGGFLGMQSLRWEIIGFARDIKNLIDFDTFDPITNQDVFGNVAGTVKVRGAELVLDAALGDEFSGNFSYTFNDAHDPSHQQIDRVPEQIGKATLDYHPLNMPFGLFATLNYVGTVHTTVGGIGRVEYGDYFVVDLSGRLFLDATRHHRIDLGVYNIFDKEYASLPARGRTDAIPPATSANYLVENLGLPRTLYMRYTYNFF
jgi:vitamin B12 transporter